MKAIERAICQDLRKKGKTFLMFFIILVIGTLILTCFSIQSATQTALLNVRQSLKGAFTIDVKTSDSKLTDNTLNYILSIPGVESAYNARSNSYAEYKDAEGKPLEVRTAGAYDVVEGFEHAGKLMGDTFSEKDSLFQKEGFTLSEGKQIEKGETGVAMVHQYLAEKNNLSIGDTIYLSLNKNMIDDSADISVDGLSENEVPVKIIGIFTTSEIQEGTMLLSHVFYENTVFTDPQSYSNLFYGDTDTVYDYADFQVNDPEKLDTIIDKVKDIDYVEWDQAVFTKQNSDYERAKSSLRSLAQMMKVIVIGILIVSMILMILVLSFWSRGRIHETGVYMAMGFERKNIFAQYLVELMLIGVFAIGLSFFTSSAIAQSVGNNLLKQAAEPEYKKESLVQDVEESEEKEEVQIDYAKIIVNVSVNNLICVYGAGMLIIFTSLLIAIYPVMRMKPKDILTVMG